MTEAFLTVFTEINSRTQQYVTDYSNADITEDLSIQFDSLPNFEKKIVGKVRDVYICRDCLVLVTSNRQSAFDRLLCSIPSKGKVLNLISQWWFEKTEDIVPNHVIACPHPNVTIGKRCSVFPVEFVMRGYITGSTSTSMWTNYNKGVRNYCGHILPEGLFMNQQLDEIKLTPTTKSDEHDELISAQEVVSSGLMTQQDWDTCSSYAHSLFRRGQQLAIEKGLILVDCKYEFGKDKDGNILVIDELHTPDSSRFWIAATYRQRMAAGQEPDNIDKEFLRKWYIQRCDPYKDAELPPAPPDLVAELSRRYLMSYEILTGESFSVALDNFHSSPIAADRAVAEYFNSNSSTSSQLHAQDSTTADGLPASNIES